MACGCASAAATTGFLADPTDQIGVPGMLAGAEITPEGDLYTGWAEYRLRIGPRLMAWNQPTRTTADPSAPILQSTLTAGSVRYTQSVFAIALGGRPVAYLTMRATDLAAGSRLARVEMGAAYTGGPQILGAHGLATGKYRYERPVGGAPEGLYQQPGEAFSSSLAYRYSARDMVRSGLLLARGPVQPAVTLPEPSTASATAVHARRVYSLPLHGRGASASLTWQIPLEPPQQSASADATLDGVSPTAARAQLRRAWAAQEAGMMSIELPEPRVTAAYRAAIVEILQSRYQAPEGWVQATNKLQYEAFWIRDAAIQTQALDLAGLHEAAAQNLAFMDRFQQPDGLFISRAEQYDGLGEALWALSEHAALTRSPAYAAAQLERIGAAVDWLAAATAGDPLGLLPPGNPHDDELAYGHISGDDLWAAAGLRSAIADATLAGAPTLAAQWQTIDARFEASLRRALAGAVARAGHIPPVLDAAGGQDWGNYYAAYPVQVLPAGSPQVRATVRWARAHMVQGLATYLDGRSLHDYLGFPIFETELEAGEPSRALAGLYAELAHTTSTEEGWEYDVRPWGVRASAVDLAPHGTFAGDYVALLRNLLVSEQPSGAITLLGGASPAWQRPGQRILVTGAPTSRGTISFSERAGAHGETLRWSSDMPAGSRLRWKLPWWARDARDSEGRPLGAEVELNAPSGSVSVSFAGSPPAQSYAATVSALDRSYRAHGQAPPIVPTG